MLPFALSIIAIPGTIALTRDDFLGPKALKDRSISQDVRVHLRHQCQSARKSMAQRSMKKLHHHKRYRGYASAHRQSSQNRSRHHIAPQTELLELPTVTVGACRVTDGVT
jgi:hypothetical protein